MSDKQHSYEISVRWRGETAGDDAMPGAYSRNHTVQVAGKPPIEGSSDPAFHGDDSRYNPEELLVVALSQCHMLWYLGLCAKRGVNVTSYEDAAHGTMIEHRDGSGEFTEVVLRPTITLSDASAQEVADSLHAQAHHLCFIARSVNFEVWIEPTYA